MTEAARIVEPAPPRAPRWLAWLAAFVFTFVLPAHLAHADHRHDHALEHAAHAVTAAVPASDCGTCLTQSVVHESHHHEHGAHERAWSLPGKLGANASKWIATASEALPWSKPQATPRIVRLELDSLAPARTDAARPLPRGPPARSTAR